AVRDRRRLGVRGHAQARAGDLCDHARAARRAGRGVRVHRRPRTECSRRGNCWNARHRAPGYRGDHRGAGIAAVTDEPPPAGQRVRPKDFAPFAFAALIGLASVILPGPPTDWTLYGTAAALTVALSIAGFVATRTGRGRF